MTIENTPDGDAAEAMLSDAKRHFENINQAHQDGLDKLADSADRDVRAYSSLAQLHWKAMQSVLERQHELNRINREKAGIVHGYALDLDAARTEVGRRLACLKDASGG